VSRELTLVVSYLEKTPFGEFYGDIVMRSTTPSVGLIDLIYNKPLDLTPTSSPLPPTTLSHAQAFHESLGDLRDYCPSFDLYCAYLEDVPRIIMWSTFFDHTFDFSMAIVTLRGH